MPELPEVETVARDLRRARRSADHGGRVSWLRTAALAGPRWPSPRPSSPVARSSESGGAPSSSCSICPATRAHDPSQDDRPAVRRPGRDARGSVRPAGARARRRPRAPLPRHPQVRADRAVRPRSGDRRARHRGRRTGVFAPFGPEPLDPAFTLRDFRRGLRRRKGRLKPLLLDQSFLAGVGNIYADEALWAARLHPLRTAGRSGRPTSGACIEAIRRILAEAVERRGSSIDDYTAPDGDGSMQEHLHVYQRTGEPCPRCGRPIKRIVIGARSTHFCSWCQRLPPADRKGAAAILRTMTGGPRRAGRRWTELAGEGTLGRPRPRPPGPPRRPDRADEAGRRDPPGGRARVGAGRGGGPARCRILRLTGVTREVGTFVILDAIDASIALGDRIGLVGPNGAGKTTLLRLASGRDEPDRGEVHRKRGLTLGLLAQEAHFDEAFMASPDLRPAVRPAPRTSTGWPSAWRRSSATGASRRAGLRGAPAPVRVLGGYTLDQRVDEALTGLGFAPRRVGASRRRRCPAASRRGRRSPASSSPTRTCCSSTSPRTTSTSTRSSGWRSTCAGGAGRCSWPRTTGRSSTRR